MAMLFRARRATFEMMNFCCVFFKDLCARDRFNLESTFSCLFGESYIYEHDFLFFSGPNARLSHEHYEVPALPWSLYSFLIHMKKKRKETKKTV